jgi:molybdopterin synthase sulfur carrier subunit
VSDTISRLHRRFNGIRDRLCDDRGRLRDSVPVFVNDEDIRFLREQSTPLQPGDEVSIIPAFAGG